VAENDQSDFGIQPVHMLNFIPPIMLMLLITATSSIPMDGSVPTFAFLTALKPDIQNLLHIPVFGCLAFLWLRAFCNRREPVLICIVAAMTMTIAFGMIDELHQMVVPGRYAGLQDVILNIVGAGLGIVAFMIFIRIKNKT
jgi:glycopeptide antibiotics resistance protein